MRNASRCVLSHTSGADLTRVVIILIFDFSYLMCWFHRSGRENDVHACQLLQAFFRATSTLKCDLEARDTYMIGHISQ